MKKAGVGTRLYLLLREKRGTIFAVALLVGALAQRQLLPGLLIPTQLCRYMCEFIHNM